MATHAPLKDTIARWRERNRQDIDERKKSKIESELERQAQEREKQAEISYALNDVKITLNSLDRRFEEIFDRELTTARRNASKKIKDGRNYSKIGVAFYSKQVVSAAKKRLQDLDSAFEINTMMGELTSALRVVNELPKVIGRVDSKELNKAVGRMDKAAGSSGGDMMQALSALSELKLDGAGTLPVEGLVSKEEIERWIKDRDYADECLENGSGSEINGDDILDIGTKVRLFESGQSEQERPSLNSTLDELRKTVNNL